MKGRGNIPCNQLNQPYLEGIGGNGLMELSFRNHFPTQIKAMAHVAY